MRRLPQALSGQRARMWAAAGLLVLLLVTLDLMSGAVQNSVELSRIFVPLLVVNLLGLVVVLGLIGSNILSLVRDYRARSAGSRLNLRLVMIFVLLGLPPVAVVYFYSLSFLMKGIDSWFDVQIDQAMEDALDLSQASIAQNQKVLLRYTESLLKELEGLSDEDMAINLSSLREQAGATELAVINVGGMIIAFANESPTVLVPEKPGNEVLQRLWEGKDYVGLIPRGEEDLQIRVVVRAPKGGSNSLILQGIFPTSQHIGSLSSRMEDAYNRYKELSYLRASLKINFSLTLTLVLMFSLLGAVWAALYSARRLVAPVTEIAKGTRAVAAGDYGKQLALPKARDELTFLVASFNAMTRRIAQARDEAARSRQEVEEQRAYLETVLGRLSSGVMTFDAQQILRTANPAAGQILRVELELHLGRSLSELGTISSPFHQFVEAIRQPLEQTSGEWREEVTLYGSEGRQVLLCRSTAFTLPGAGEKGHVLVFDDVTTLIKAQRDAAWGEVARRLAHEIKNPLTPIQLAAERLRHKYLRTMPEDDARVLDRATHTIVQQVDAMKEMVNAFSDYARPPKMQPEPLEVDALVAEVLDLYQTAGTANLEVRLDAGEARIEGDPLRLRQVVHNLVKNAQEAISERVDGRVSVHTSVVTEEDCRFFELRVDDNGPGFEEQVLTRLFEPYVTTKVKGTGLGMAIVKKIVEEHGGIISAGNSTFGGCVVLRLPLAGTGDRPLRPCRRLGGDGR